MNLIPVRRWKMPEDWLSNNRDVRKLDLNSSLDILILTSFCAL